MPAIHETTGTVKSVSVEYDVDKTWGSYKPHFDMFLTVEYNDGQSWDKTLEVFGNVRKNLPVTDPKSWGSAFKVKTFFESCLGKKNLMMSDGYSLPDNLFDEVIGKQFMVAAYKTNKIKKRGKPFWNTYSIVAPSNALPGTLKTKVLNDVKNGWIKNYESDDPSTDFDLGNNSKESKPAESVNPLQSDSNFDLDI